MFSEPTDNEMESLIALFGKPEKRFVRMQADEYLIQTRRMRANKRRGEIVIALQRPENRILLHRKSWYEPGVYRLPTGGIKQDEGIADALERELREETGLNMLQAAFLGILQVELVADQANIRFDSYVFHVMRAEGNVRLPISHEDISDFQDIEIEALPGVSMNLRAIAPPRRGWGHWRAIAHDFVYEKLRSM